MRCFIRYLVELSSTWFYALLHIFLSEFQDNLLKQESIGHYISISFNGGFRAINY